MPSHKAWRIAAQCKRAYSAKSSMGIPSLPGAPWLGITRFHARCRFARSTPTPSDHRARLAAWPRAATHLPPVGLNDGCESPTAPPWLLMFGPSPPGLETSAATMDSADFCPLTPGIAPRRALPTGRAAASFSCAAWQRRGAPGLGEPVVRLVPSRFGATAPSRTDQPV